MKFSLFVHIERISPDQPERQLYEEMLELCRIADEGGDACDLDSAVNAKVSGIFSATGQSFVAGSRLLIHSNIKDAFLAKLQAKAEAIVIAAPDQMTTEVGPLCTDRQRIHIADLIARSVAKGARIVTGGAALDRAGFYFAPTILDCSDAPHAPAIFEEFFGPVLTVVSFDTEEQAIQLAIDTEYGLAAEVFTNNLTRAHRMIRALWAGVVWFNTYRAVSPIAPFGGYGMSGHGREGGLAAALDYTTTKTVWLRTSDAPIPDPFVMR